MGKRHHAVAKVRREPASFYYAARPIQCSWCSTRLGCCRDLWKAAISGSWWHHKNTESSTLSFPCNFHALQISTVYLLLHLGWGTMTTESSMNTCA